jgi:hypothetical protein
MSFKKLKHSLLGLALAGVFAGQVYAGCDKSYAFRADVGANTGSEICSSTSSSFIDAIKNFNLSNTGYTDTSAATVAGKFNDVNINLSYAATSTTLNYSFAELGISGSFTGATRAESQKLFEDYLKKNDILGKIMKYQAEHSASSPITGAGGLIPMTAAGDFDSAFTASATQIAGSNQAGAASNNLVGIGATYGVYTMSGSSDKTTTMSLPLSYTVRNGIDPRRQLIISLPITQTTTGNAKSYQIGLGLAYRFPITDNWTVTPGIKYSYVASVDRATVAALASASLTSAYLIPMNGYDIGIGNMLGYYETQKFSAGEYSFNPNIKQFLTRNGVMVSQPVSLAGKKMSVEYALTDTRYLSNKPYVDNYQELSVSLGTNKSAADSRSHLRAGLSLMSGRGMSGYMFNLRYSF